MSTYDWLTDNDPTRAELEAQVGVLENERDSWKDQVEALRVARDLAIERIVKLQQAQEESAKLCTGHAYTLAHVQAEAFSRAADLVRRIVR